MGNPTPHFHDFRTWRTVPYRIILNTKLLQLIQEKTKPFFKHNVFGNRKILELPNFENLGKEGGRTILKIRLIIFENLEYVYSRKHEMGHLGNLEYGIKIPQHHEMEILEVLNMASISSREHDLEIW